MKPAKLAHFLQPTLRDAGFTLDQIDDQATYGDRPGWAIYYLGADCKLQVCWSARDGGIDFLLAPLDAPYEFGLLNCSKKWQFMLILSAADDELPTPGLGADDDTIMAWLKALFEIHFGPAHAALISET